jgi:fucose 4-O-acetylase-like acetyltransferase
MLIGSKQYYINNKRKLTILGFIDSIVLIFLIYCVYNGIFNFENDIFGVEDNPPGLVLILYSMLVLLLVYTIDCLACSNMTSNNKFNIISFLGKHTLYVFLYHLVILDMLTPLTEVLINCGINKFMIFSLIYLITYLLSIILEYIIESLIRQVNKVLNI